MFNGRMIGRRFATTSLIAAIAFSLTGTAIAAEPVIAGQAVPITAQERQQGQQANPSIVSEYGGPYTGPQAVYAEKVGRKIAVQSGLSDSPTSFTVTLLNSPVDNAFAIPGGYVYSTRQLLALMNDEAELAAVLGHEVAHVAARHSNKRQSAAQTNAIFGALGQLLVGAVAGNSAFGGLLSKGIGTGSQLLTLRYSRGQETQADDLGIAYLAKAGYDPSAMATLLADLAAQDALDARIAGTTRSTPVWASTHPDPASRVVHAQQQAAALHVTGGVRNRDAFLTAVDGLLYGDDPKQGIVDGQKFLHADLGIGFSIPPGFAMQNSTDAVSVTGNGGQAQFSNAGYNGDMRAYIATVLRGIGGNDSSSTSLPQFNVERTTINGLPVGYTTVRANNNGSQVDVTIMAYELSAKSAVHFVVLPAAGQGLGALQPMVQSFHKLSRTELAGAKPRYLRVVTVRSGDTVDSLSKRMAYDSYQRDRFLVLNGLTANASLKPGTRVKIVTY